MSQHKQFQYLYEKIQDIFQVLQADLLPIYKQRIIDFLKAKGEMRESDCWTTLPVKRQEWRSKEGSINNVSRWLFWEAFNALKKERMLVEHRHGRGHPRTWTLKEAES